MVRNRPRGGRAERVFNGLNVNQLLQKIQSLNFRMQEMFQDYYWFLCDIIHSCQTSYFYSSQNIDLILLRLLSVNYSLCNIYFILFYITFLVPSVFIWFENSGSLAAAISVIFNHQYAMFYKNVLRKWSTNYFKFLNIN